MKSPARKIEKPAALPVSPVFDALLEACGLQCDPQRLQQACSKLDTEQCARLLELADKHGVTGLVHTSLSKLETSVVPSSVASTLEARHTTNVHKSLLQTRELLRVLHALEESGIEAVPYKGLVLAELVYGDLAMRQAGDMDVLVRGRDVPRARQIAEALGYTPCLKLSDEEMQRYLHVGYELSFDFGRQRNLLEFKWAILPAFYAFDFDMDAIFSAQKCSEFSGTEIRQLAAEDLFLILCAHAAKHSWERLIWLCDIARLAHTPLDWQQIAGKSRELGMRRVVRITLGLTNELLRSEIPLAPFFDHADDSDAVAEDLTSESATEILLDQPADPESMAYFRRMIRMRERFADRARFISRLAFTPGPGEWNAIKLQGIWSPLYRVVRVGRLGTRLWRGLG